jgi:DNA-binding response OmpR family regulator
MNIHNRKGLRRYVRLTPVLKAVSVGRMAEPTKKHTVLIADDDPEILTMLGIRLSKKGYQVIEAADGNETLELARKHRPDLVLLDVMMPGKNGWEVAKELRTDIVLGDIGIVMLTAIGERINEMTSPLYDADEFVDKPFEFADLEKKIRQVLEARDRRR